MIDDVNKNYDNRESGINGILSALGDFRSYVIVLFDAGTILGAASYYISKKDYIEVDHIGVSKSHRGYGTILMNEIFNIAKLYKKLKVTLVTNGYSNEFYEKIGMIHVNDKLPAVYEKIIGNVDNHQY